MLLHVRDDRPELLALLGAGDSCLGEQRLRTWAEFTLPVPPNVPNNLAVHKDRRWSRLSASPLDPTLILGHFRGEHALGGVYVKTTRAFVVDLDNRAGKHSLLEGSPITTDAHLDLRQRLALEILPVGLWVRSSASHGLHRWAFFSEPVDILDLAHWASARLRRAVDLHRREIEQLSPMLRDLLYRACEGSAGSPGVLELLPYCDPKSRGAVIRAPFGPGSALLRPGEVITDPPAALAHFCAFVDNPRNLLDPGDVPPRPVVAVPPLPPTPPLAIRPVTPSALRPRPSPGKAPADLTDRIARSHGRLHPSVRASRDEQRQTAQLILEHGFPPHCRHSATFLLAFSSKVDKGLTSDEIKDQMLDLMSGPVAAHSNEMRANPAATLAKTSSIVDFLHRDRLGLDAQPPPVFAPLARADLRALEALLPRDGGLVRTAYLVLSYVRANGRLVGPDTYDCEINKHKVLDARNRRTRDRWFRELRRLGFITFRRRHIPQRLPDDHPYPQKASATLYRLRWTFATEGPFDDPPSPRDPKGPSKPRRNRTTSIGSSPTPKIAATEGLFMHPDSLHETNEIPPQLSPEAARRPVGAVDGEAVKGARGKVGVVSELSTGPSASTGPDNATQLAPEELSERGPGGDRAQEADFALLSLRPLATPEPPSVVPPPLLAPETARSRPRFVAIRGPPCPRDDPRDSSRPRKYGDPEASLPSSPPGPSGTLDVSRSTSKDASTLF